MTVAANGNDAEVYYLTNCQCWRLSKIDLIIIYNVRYRTRYRDVEMSVSQTFDGR